MKISLPIIAQYAAENLKVGEVGMTKYNPNKITATMKLVVTGEFYDDEASEETLRYCIEQDLEDAGFDVDVSLLKDHAEDNNVPSKWVSVKDKLPERPENWPRCEIRRCYFLVSLQSGCVRTLSFNFTDMRWPTIGSPVTHWMPLPEPPKEVSE